MEFPISMAVASSIAVEVRREQTVSRRSQPNSRIATKGELSKPNLSSLSMWR